ncbi:MAG: hypothetical protein AB7G68_00980 [Nitrospiraceae bacterium]
MAKIQLTDTFSQTPHYRIKQSAPITPRCLPFGHRKFPVKIHLVPDVARHELHPISSRMVLAATTLTRLMLQP